MGCRLQTDLAAWWPTRVFPVLWLLRPSKGLILGSLATLAPTYEEQQPRDKVEGHSFLLAVLPVQVQQCRRQQKEAHIADLKNKMHTQILAIPIPPRTSVSLCVRRILISSRGLVWKQELLSAQGEDRAGLGLEGQLLLWLQWLQTPLPSLWGQQAQGELLCPFWVMLVYLQLPGVSKQLLCSGVNPDPPGAAWMAPDPSSLQ